MSNESRVLPVCINSPSILNAQKVESLGTLPSCADIFILKMLSRDLKCPSPHANSRGISILTQNPAPSNNECD